MSETSVINHHPLETLDIGLYREGSELIADLKSAIPEGTRRGIHLICEAAADRKRTFDESLVQDINRRIMYYMPGIAGGYRTEGEDVRLRGKEKIDGQIKVVEYPLINGLELNNRMYAFGRWLEEKTEDLKSDQNRNDVRKALVVACEASYGLVSPDLHPFREGNGRTARLLANGILMINATELQFHGIKLLPVPLVRDSSYHMGIDSDGNIGVDPYVLTLNHAHRTKDLTPYVLLVAHLWRNNLVGLMVDFQTAVKSGHFPKLSNADKYVLDRFETRMNALHQFILDQDPKNNPPKIMVPFYKPSRFNGGY